MVMGASMKEVSMPKFRFDPETHTYYLDDVVIPGATSVLPYNYHGGNKDAMTKGSYVHQMIELYSQGVLDEESLDPVLKGYLDSYKKIVRMLKMDCNNVWDFKTGSPHPCTALQLAAYVLLCKEGLSEDNSPLLPEKRYHEVRLYHPTYRFAGTVDFAWLKSDSVIFRAVAIYLQGDGSIPILEDHTKDLRRNIPIFLSFLTTYKFKKENNL
jgi:hypothetical protein